MENYRRVMDRAFGIGDQGYVPYTGELTAGMNDYQWNAINTLNGAQSGANPIYNQGRDLIAAGGNIAQGALPYFDTAAGFASRGAGPVEFEGFSRNGLSQYYNPYEDRVVGNAMEDMRHADAVAQNGALGTAIRSGNAFGGDRMGVAAAELARGQSAARNSTIAGLRSSGYTDAANRYMNERQQDYGARAADAQRFGQAGQSFANMGTARAGVGQGVAGIGTGMGGLASSLQGNATQSGLALLQGGNTQNAWQQGGLDRLYQQFMQQQQFPYQQTSWLGGLASGMGSNMGGTSTSTTPGASPFSQVLGGVGTAVGLAGMFGLKRGGRVRPRRRGFAAGGTVPYSVLKNGLSDLEAPMVRGSGPPRTSAPSGGGAADPGIDPAAVASLARGLDGLRNRPMDIMPAGQSFSPSAVGTTFAMDGLGGGITGGLPAIYKRGGRVCGFADGGFVDSFDDRFGTDYLPPENLVDPEQFRDQYFAVNGADPRMFAEAGPQTAGVPLPRPRPAMAPPAGVRDLLPRELADMDPEPLPGPAMAYDAPARRGVPPMGAPAAPQPAGLASAPPATPFTMPGREPGTIERAMDSPWAALAAAGLGMMASRNPSVLGAVGEGGLAGMSTLSKQRESIRKANEPKINTSSGTIQLVYPDGRMLDTGLPTMTAGQREQNNRLREAHGENVAARRQRDKDTAEFRRDSVEQRREQAKEREDTRRDLAADRGEQRREREAARVYPGTGTDEEGKQVPGLYQYDPESREYVFKPGKQIQTGKGRSSDGAARDPARVREAQVLVDKGVAPDFPTAYNMVRSGVNDGATWQRLIQAEKKGMGTETDWMGKKGDEIEEEAVRRVLKRRERIAPQSQGGAPAAASPAAQGPSSAAPAAAPPPAPGARKAPDGKWYVPDPARPGKYLQVQ